ncbi:hypothetical protein J3459_018360 [Metarhizium acridum]|nr:hypothetical protein J3459_018360 [Metarhizium acridum]
MCHRSHRRSRRKGSWWRHAGLTFPNSYASAKQSLLASSNMSDNVTTHVLASLMAGTVATTLCAPADVLKSRMQSSASGDASSFLFGHCS